MAPKKGPNEERGHFYVSTFFVSFSISRRIPSSALIRPLNRPIKVPSIDASRAKYRATSLGVERSSRIFVLIFIQLQSTKYQQ